MFVYLQMLRNLGPSRFISQRNSMPQNILSSARPTTVPLLRPPAANRVQSEVIANSKIVPIPQKNRKHHLVISKESVQICIDEINNRIPTNSASTLIVTEPAIDLITAEVTYRLFYLLRVRVYICDTYRIHTLLLCKIHYEKLQLTPEIPQSHSM